jgi:hypothetical protein
MNMKILDWLSTVSVSSDVDLSDLATALIAALALFVSVWNAWIQRRHSRLSVTPHIDFIYGEMDSPLSVNLLNNGIGPARVLNFSVFVDGTERSAATPLGLLGGAVQQLDLKGSIWTDDIRAGQVIAAGKKIPVIVYSDLNLQLDDSTEDAARNVRAFESSLRRIKIVVDYESFYGQGFSSTWTLPEHLA